jgi:hypothetical protein
MLPFVLAHVRRFREPDSEIDREDEQAESEIASR